MAKTTNLATGGSRIGRPELKEIGRILFNGIQQTLPLMTGYLMFVTLLPFKKNILSWRIFQPAMWSITREDFHLPLKNSIGYSRWRVWGKDPKVRHEKKKKNRISSKLGSFFFQTKRLLRLAKKKRPPPKKNYSSAQDTGQWLKGHHETTSAFESQKKKGSNCCVNVLKFSPVLLLPILII